MLFHIFHLYITLFNQQFFYLMLFGILNVVIYFSFKCNILLFNLFSFTNPTTCRSQWPGGLRHHSVAAASLGSWVRIPTGQGCLCLVSVVCCQVSSMGPCDGLITRTEESYRVWCVQWAWSWRFVRGGHEPEPNQCAKGKKERKKEKLNSRAAYKIVHLSQISINLNVFKMHRVSNFKIVLSYFTVNIFNLKIVCVTFSKSAALLIFCIR